MDKEEDSHSRFSRERDDEEEEREDRHDRFRRSRSRSRSRSPDRRRRYDERRRSPKRFRDNNYTQNRRGGGNYGQRWNNQDNFSNPYNKRGRNEFDNNDDWDDNYGDKRPRASGRFGGRDSRGSNWEEEEDHSVVPPGEKKRKI